MMVICTCMQKRTHAPPLWMVPCTSQWQHGPLLPCWTVVLLMMMRATQAGGRVCTRGAGLFADPPQTRCLLRCATVSTPGAPVAA